MTNAVNVNEQTLDVRPMPPRERHPAILKAWNQLQAGGALLLVNDHDPLPLYYQFACEHGGGFRWDYVESGPDTWQVRISKGNYPDPGFVPVPKTDVSQTATRSGQSVVLDVRPVFAAGNAPCSVIDDAVASVGAGESFVLLVPFEPAPLYAKLGRQGFSHQTRQLDDGSYRIEFKKSA